jgi:hypothetical protein
MITLGWAKKFWSFIVTLLDTASRLIDLCWVFYPGAIVSVEPTPFNWAVTQRWLDTAGPQRVVLPCCSCEGWTDINQPSRYWTFQCREKRHQLIPINAFAQLISYSNEVVSNVCDGIVWIVLNYFICKFPILTEASNLKIMS